MDVVARNTPPSGRVKRAGNRPPRRGRYVSKACLGCRRRKTKCTGDIPCEACRVEALDCCYAAGPARIRKPRPQHGRESRSSPSESQDSRIRTLCKTSIPTGRSPGGTNVVEQDKRRKADSRRAAPSVSPATSIDCWDGLLTVDSGSYTPVLKSAGISVVGLADSPPGSLVDDVLLPVQNTLELNKWNIQAKLLEVQKMRTMVRHFLVKVNPRVLCLPAQQLHQDVEMLLAGQNDDRNQLQRVALVDLVMALIQVMVGEGPSAGSTPPGFREFRHAEQLLSEAAWASAADLKVIQCRVLQTMYLIYTDRYDIAYDVMGTATRLCRQLGLCDRSNWSLSLPSEAHTQHRTVWAVFNFDRLVSEHCSLPYHLQLSDLETFLPRQTGSALLELEPEQAIPSEISKAPVCYVYYMYRHSILLTEVLDSVQVRDGEAPTEETVATIDAHIESLRAELPTHLQWRLTVMDTARSREAQSHIRGSLLLHLLLNSLRLLLKHRQLESRSYLEPDPTSLCLEIAADSIQSLRTYYNTSFPDPIERHGSVRFLLDALHPLGRIILHSPQLAPPTLRQALATFNTGLSLVKEFAPHLASARTALDQMQGMIVDMSHRRQECLLTGTLEDCFQWINFPTLGDLHKECDTEEAMMHSALYRGDDGDFEQFCGLSSAGLELGFLHTENWVTGC